MYINPFLAGVLAVILVQFALLVIAALISQKKK